MTSHSEEKTEPVTGIEHLSFRLDSRRTVLLDFRDGTDRVDYLCINGKEVPVRGQSEHLILDGRFLEAGQNRVEVGFTAGDQALNRNDGYLYTLLVPALARTVFPCFDQPDLKAVFGLTLDLPRSWVGVSDGSLREETLSEDRKMLVFNDTKPVSTYLFSFVAGEWQMAADTVGGLPMKFYYRETDPAKLAQIPEVFRLAGEAVRWMEDYTGIAYPFEKYDFIAIPGYQFGGMEHPGAIQFTDKRIFLGPEPTVDEQLSRSDLIAHETAHMWFGDAVTMRWFDDVWTKEVFANWFAATITAPQFPGVDTPLKDFKKFNIPAYEEDRSAGSNAIKQQLDNLSDAGLIYGNIVYYKAPAVMNMLARKMGPDAFRAGLQEYLATFLYGNADWNDLIAILDRHTPDDLAAWSHSWVEEKGMPSYRVSLENGEPVVSQTDPWGRGLAWPQDVEVTRAGDALLLNVPGTAYGSFAQDSVSLAYTMAHLAEFRRPVERISLLANLYENMLEGRLPADRFARFLAGYLPAEPEALLVSTGLSYLASMARHGTLAHSPALEEILADLSRDKRLGTAQSAAFRSLVSLFRDPGRAEELYAVWKEKTPWEGVTLSESNYTTMAFELAVRLPQRSEAILSEQRGRIANADRLREFDYIRPSVSPDPAVRDSVFRALLIPENRRHEPWAESALQYLNHPLRQAEAVAFIRPALAAVPDIQRTGDIFFPKKWMTALLRGHDTPEAAAQVRGFLAENPDFPPLLRGKLLQAADPLLRNCPE